MYFIVFFHDTVWEGFEGMVFPLSKGASTVRASLTHISWVQILVLSLTNYVTLSKLLIPGGLSFLKWKCVDDSKTLVTGLLCGFNELMHVKFLKWTSLVVQW